VRERKLARVPRLKQAMRDMLVASAASLDTVPRDERIVIGVTLFYFSWEDASGMPQQVVMSAPRRDLLEFQAGRLQQDALGASIHLEEY
jgi:hypothetical protein